MKLLRTSAAVAMGLTGLAAPLSAEPVVVTGETLPSAVVSYADLNLATAGGREELDERVYRAATRLCDADVMRPLQIKRHHDQCRREAVASVQPLILDAVERRQIGTGATAYLTLSTR